MITARLNLQALYQRLDPGIDQRPAIDRETTISGDQDLYLRGITLCCLGVGLWQIHEQPCLTAKCCGYHEEDKQQKHHVYERCHIDGEFFTIGSFEFQVAVFSLTLL